MIEFLEGVVAILNGQGEPRVIIQDRPDGPLVLLFHRDGRAAGGLTFSPVDGGLVCTLADAEEVVRTAIKIQDGEPIVCTFDREGNVLSGRRLEEPPVKAPNLAVSLN